MRSVWRTLYRYPKIQLGALLAAPLGWLVIAYLGSLALLFVSSFWTIEPFSGSVVTQPSLENFETILTQPVYRTITLRTVTVAAIVTIADILLAFPIAYYMARVASPRTRGILVVSILLPLWSGYLVKAYAWRVILSEGGVLNWILGPTGLKGPGFGDIAVVIVFTYLWLPFMVLPIYAGLERIPHSILEASADLGARGGQTFRKVVLPLALPAVVAGSIFTFSLTLGDYIVPSLMGSSQFIGNVVYSNISVNQPLAAAFALVPVAIMLVYLAIARRLGAFEAL